LAQNDDARFRVSASAVIQADASALILTLAAFRRSSLVPSLRW